MLCTGIDFMLHFSSDVEGKKDVCVPDGDTRGGLIIRRSTQMSRDAISG